MGCRYILRIEDVYGHVDVQLPGKTFQQRFAGNSDDLKCKCLPGELEHYFRPNAGRLARRYSNTRDGLHGSSRQMQVAGKPGSVGGVQPIFYITLIAKPS